MADTPTITLSLVHAEHLVTLVQAILQESDHPAYQKYLEAGLALDEAVEEAVAAIRRDQPLIGAPVADVEINAENETARYLANDPINW